LTGHGVSEELQQKIINVSSKFFKKPIDEKNEIHMKKGGKAWRGYFSTG
jgi:isopenicillin N synthase-like dioxygenase